MTDMNEETCHKVVQRVHFSRYFKRRALIEFARLKKPNEALRACGFDVDKAISKDKNYASKLLSKWRKELYQNYRMLCFMNFEMEDDVLKSEIELLQSKNKSRDRIINRIAPKLGEYVKLKKDRVEYFCNLLDEFGIEYKS